MAIYERYAPLYDASGQVRFALLTHDFLGQLLVRHAVPGRRVLDLACGTGTLATLLAADGWLVVGLDQSAAMLAVASAKADERQLGEQLVFVQGDMRAAHEVVAPASIDLVTCTYDSLNYLLDADELAACFAAVAATLVPGGLFVADMNTRYFLEHDWEACLIRELSGYVQIEQSQFDPTTSTSRMLLTGFLGDDESGYERFDEQHVERAYPPDEIARLLAAAGLHLEAQYDSFTFSPPGLRTQRIFFVARRH